jgi:hypothetical protein
MAVPNNAQPAAIIEADNAMVTAQVLGAGTQEKDRVVENIEENGDAMKRTKDAPKAGLVNYFVSGFRPCDRVANLPCLAGIYIRNGIGLLSCCSVLSHFDSLRNHNAFDDSHLWWDRLTHVETAVC